MTKYPSTKITRIGDWFRIYVLTNVGWTWHIASKNKKEAKKIAKMLKA